MLTMTVCYGNKIRVRTMKGFAMINAKKTHRLEIRIDETELEQFNLKHLALQEQLWEDLQRQEPQRQERGKTSQAFPQRRRLQEYHLSNHILQG